MKRILIALALCLIASTVFAASIFYPFNLHLGIPFVTDSANVEYTGKAYSVPADATSSYARLLDKGKKPKDDAVVYSGQMLDLDGVDDDVITAQFAVSGIQFTRTMTIKTTSNFRTGWIVNGGTAERFYIGSTLAGIGDSYTEHGLTMRDGNYHRVVLIRDGNTGKVYFDSELALSITGCGLTEWTSLKAYFGSYDSGTARFLDGQIGNVQIWSKAFTAEEVAADYANPENVDTSDPHLKGWWPLIEGSGDTAYDWSGNGNHGTLTNFDTAICWNAGKALSNPRVLQTAYMSWNLDAGVLRPVGTSGGADFTREYDELNFNGKSRSKTDITAAGTYSVEMVINISDVTDLQYLMDGQYGSGAGYIRQTGGTIAASSGTIYVDNSVTTTVTAGMAHVVVSGITLDVTKIFLGDWYDYATTAHTLTGQMPMFKIWEGALDVAAVAKKYVKAARKYNLGD